MSLRQKFALAISDFFLVWLGLVVALGLRVDFDGEKMARYIDHQSWFFPALGATAVFVFYLIGLYERLWRYAGIRELGELAVAVTVTLVPFQVIAMSGRGVVYPRTGLLLAWFVVIALCGGLRLCLRLASEGRREPARDRRVLIVGTNDAGESALRDLRRSDLGVAVVGFIHTGAGMKRGQIRGVPILGAVDDLPEVVEHHQVHELILAQLKPQEAGAVVRACQGLELSFSTVPATADLVAGRVQVSKLRELRIEDLLDRDPVSFDPDSLRAYLEGKRVLVTGAGGSIGSEICRQVLRFSPAELVLLGRGENSVHEIARELNSPLVKSVICDVRNQEMMGSIFARFRPQVIFHAAAHKHVHLMEQAPAEAVSNNVGGTLTVMELARKFDCERFILLSTDKAVNPCGVMGATKRLCELLIARGQDRGFAAVRFGNVLGSRGSVVPTFLRQIAEGGPVTVTDPQMSRYFMTIPEAVALVLQAGALAHGGEIYILDMGEPVKILDLARNLIRLSGFEPDKDIAISLVGRRKGEKTHEELTGDGENFETTDADKILRVASTPMLKDWPGDALTELLEAARAADDGRCRDLLGQLVNTFQERRETQGVSRA